MIHVMRYGGLRGAPLPTVKQQLVGFLEQVQPGWRNKLVRMRFVPQMVVSNAIASAAAGGLAGRPGPSVPGLPGVYVAGDWVGPRGMLADASLSSAKQAAGTILAGAVRAEQAA
jgi:phytoene dehydrogenase-like protein